MKKNEKFLSLQQVTANNALEKITIFPFRHGFFMTSKLFSSQKKVTTSSGGTLSLFRLETNTLMKVRDN